MEYLKAADMKKLTDSNNEKMTDKVLVELFECIQHAAEVGLYYVRVDILPTAIAAKLKDMGYKVKYDVREDKEIISWRE